MTVRQSLKSCHNCSVFLRKYTSRAGWGSSMLLLHCYCHAATATQANPTESSLMELTHIADAPLVAVWACSAQLMVITIRTHNICSPPCHHLPALCKDLTSPVWKQLLAWLQWEQRKPSLPYIGAEPALRAHSVAVKCCSSKSPSPPALVVTQVRARARSCWNMSSLLAGFTSSKRSGFAHQMD